MVASKQSINSNIDKILLAVNKKRDKLLQQVDDIQSAKKKEFESKLKTLKRIKSICEVSKRQFESISINQKMASNEKKNKLEKLLAMNIGQNDDEKKDNYDHLKVVGSECVYPGVVNFKFDENAFFDTTMTCLMSVSCVDIKGQWNMKQCYHQKSVSIINDGWDSKFKGERMAVKGDTVELTTGYYQSAFLQKEVFSGVHRWKFKIADLKHNNRTHHFGILGTKCTGDPTAKFFHFSPSYSFCAGQGFTYGPGDGEHFSIADRNYAKDRKCQSDDIVEMICDFHKMTLRFIVNGKDYGIAFRNIQKCTYRAAVHVQKAEEAIQFLEHTVTH